MIQKIEKAVAVALATASILSLALGVAFTLTHGPAAFIEQTTLENSAAYLKGWIDAIKGDTKLAISAASAATKAANLILNK